MLRSLRHIAETIDAVMIAEGSFPVEGPLEDSSAAPRIGDGKEVGLKADLFNVFNRQVAEVIEERYNTGTGLRNTYGAVLSYSNPRSVKFTPALPKTETGKIQRFKLRTKA